MENSAFRRLFFALWPEPEARDALVAATRSLAAGGRLQHPEDLHLTLVFLGPVPEAQMACIENVARAVRVAPFSLTLERFGHWPRPRILWAAPAAPPPGLELLVEQLQTGLSGCGFEPEQRPYRPHVTLARKAAPRSPGPLAVPVSWRVERFVLAASHSGPRTPRYRILKKWPLRS